MGRPEALIRLAGVVAERMPGASTDDAGDSASSARTSALMDALELFVPQMLREDFPEWEAESLDGFLLANFNASADGVVTLVGLAVLIGDQTVTPFCVALHPALDGSLDRAEVLLGERGGGALGISGPICTDASVSRRLEDLVPRLSSVDWVYRAAYTKREAPRPADS